MNKRTEQLLNPRLLFGGAFLRLWIPGKGLAQEIPTCMVRDRDSCEIIAFGDEAAGMVGKIPNHLEFIRPFYADEIVDREAFRSLLEHVLVQDQQSLSWRDRLIRPWNYHVALPPTVSELHAQWLKKTAREAGIWRWNPYDPFLMIAQKIGERERGASVVGIVDIGFSAARAAVYVGDELVESRASKVASLSNFCAYVVDEEQRRFHNIFSPSVLYDQQWFIQHVGFSEETEKAITEPIHKESFRAAQKKWHAAGKQLLSETLQSVSNEIQASLSHHGWNFFGGGANIPGVIDNWSAGDSIPLRMYKHTRYGDVRFE